MFTYFFEHALSNYFLMSSKFESDFEGEFTQKILSFSFFASFLAKYKQFFALN